jgi:hypothetical protein
VHDRINVQNNPVNLIDPLGLAAGHHYVPRSLFKNAGLPRNVKKFFNKQTTGKIPGGHGWSKAHKDYNIAVDKLWNQYLKKNKINPANMTMDQARDFVKAVKKSKAKSIKSFLWGINQAQKGVPRFIGLGVGVTSLDAAFRNDPIGTLELMMNDCL